MFKSCVLDPDDCKNPLPDWIKNDGVVVYHGTSSQFSRSIEERGFVPGDHDLLPYKMDDVKIICSTYERFGWFGINDGGWSNYNTLKAYTSDSGRYDEFKPISFSSAYEYARNYASNPGGETVKAIIGAIHDFERFSSDEQLRAEHVKRQRLNQSDEYFLDQKLKYEIFIENSNDIPLLISSLAEIKNVEQSYFKIENNHKPVVYAIKTQEDWFDETPNLLSIDLRLVKPISPTDIVAKIEFQNGVNFISGSVDKVESFVKYFNQCKL